ncbi:MULTISPECIES: ROK family protein [Fusobacterium]|jgi:glucokinase|uniref:Glucokinase n=1 Tax=Fusobacterium varium ATCC 27725 TaxID=469618 RepID=A0ABM6U1M2_FUSVA|nr:MULTISPECIES: ROK family protein [Fusobacterium]AVQ30182.1 ROK family protein [Fusobacterium varium ATCC 27725]EES64788.1 putative glucokinase [Fusobacterium varium ATCC 27725]MCD7979574.1 ROK family protein [Fusobacterium sp.]MCF0170907.1 ROK family protein [Fusobacterium varium]MCI6031329.1 ROK family protein [Fusobacterium varium]
MDYYVGIDLGGTNTKIGLLNIEGDILKSSIIKTLSSEGVDKTMERIWGVIQELAKETNINVEDIKGIGMGIPGPVEEQSIVAFFANFPWGTNVNIKEKLEKITGIETKLDNDANIIALGEAKYGAAKGSKSSVTVALGTGIGGGIYVNGMLISGFKGAGGEIGHMKIVKEGRLCGCGQRGCFEAYASATGLIREAVSRLTVNKQNLLYTMIEGNIAGLEAKDIFDAAKEGDAFSLDLVDYEAEYLAMGIANILNIINPETIVLGGGVALAGDILLNPLRKKLEKYALPVTLEDLKIVQGILGNEAGIKGAVGLFS